MREMGAPSERKAPVQRLGLREEGAKVAMKRHTRRGDEPQLSSSRVFSVPGEAFLREMGLSIARLLITSVPACLLKSYIPPAQTQRSKLEHTAIALCASRQFGGRCAYLRATVFPHVAPR